MTIMVLDILPAWQTYDPQLYPDMGIKTELTRVLYTQIRGTTYRSENSNQNTINAIESRMIRPPSLFTWLTKLEFQQIHVTSPTPGQDPGYPYTAGDLFVGGSQYLMFTLGDSSEEKFGKTGTLPVKTVNLTPDNSITRFQTKQWFEPREIALYKKDEHLFTLGTVEEKNPHFSHTPGCFYTKECVYDPTLRVNEMPKAIDPNNPNAPSSEWKTSHRLSYFKYEPIRSNSPYGYSDRGQIGAVLLGWTHILVDPKNKLESDKITQIPAVKAAVIVGNNSRVIKGPGSTGGDLIELANGERMRILYTTPEGIHRYRTRIRYASNKQTDLMVYVGGGGFKTFTAPATTTNMTNLTYEKFGYLETSIYSYSSSADNIAPFEIESTSLVSGSFVIDKIEFIPIEGSLEEYEANQKLERARKVVHALFGSGAKFSKRS